MSLSDAQPECHSEERSRDAILMDAAGMSF